MSETERVSAGYMTPADFPHGTPAGFELGCKNGCPGAENGQTCEQAAIRYRGDFSYRKLVDGGATVEVLREPELFGKVAKAAKPVQPKKLTPIDVPVIEMPQAPKLGDGVDPVKDERPMPEHGTPARHARGCKSDEDCPGDPKTGKTCRRSLLDYQAEWRRKKKEEAADNAAIDAAAGVVPVAQPVDVSQESPLAPPAESLALAQLRTQLMDATEQRDLAVGALARAKERNVQLELELDVAKEKAARIPHVEYRDSPQAIAQVVTVPSLVIDPTEAGGVRVDLTGVAGPVSMSLEFKKHGLSDVYLHLDNAESVAA